MARQSRGAPVVLDEREPAGGEGEGHQRVPVPPGDQGEGASSSIPCPGALRAASRSCSAVNSGIVGAYQSLVRSNHSRGPDHLPAVDERTARRAAGSPSQVRWPSSRCLHGSPSTARRPSASSASGCARTRRTWCACSTPPRPAGSCAATPDPRTAAAASSPSPPTARRALRAAIEGAHEIQEELLAPLSAAERRTLHELLERAPRLEGLRRGLVVARRRVQQRARAHDRAEDRGHPQP